MSGSRVFYSSYYEHSQYFACVGIPVDRNILPTPLAIYSIPVAKIGYTRCFCGQNRVPFYFSVRHAPTTPSDWPTPATTRRWSHFCRVDPFLDTQLAKGTRYLYPTTRKWPGCSSQTTHHAPFEFHPNSFLSYRRKSTTTICLMYGSPGRKPQRTLYLSQTKSYTSAQRALSPSKQSPLSTAAVQRDHERRYHPPIAEV